ncbi:MAG: PQQ-binding-like beta-propeller repeat protein [Planctomycetota bacterium]
MVPQDEESENVHETPNRSLRLWPAFLIVLLQLGIMFGPHFAAQFAVESQSVAKQTVEATALDNPQTVLNSKLLGPAVGTLLLTLWWLVASRAPWIARFLAPVTIAVAAWLTWKSLHPTMLFAFFMFMIPSVTTVGIVALYLLRTDSFNRRALMAFGLVILTFIGWAQFRMTGVDGDLNSSFELRWVETEEEKFLQETRSRETVTAGAARADLLPMESDSPSYRGLRRDGVVRMESIQRDWPSTGLPEIWRQRIGPGWSSFCVVGDWLYTQEQRGDNEVVAAYDASSGQERWVRRDGVRFTESISGVGPRATPTFADGQLYTLGAMGSLQCLQADTGEVIWQRKLVDDTGASVPMWGFSSSPLVVDERVIVFAGGGSGKSIVAYDARNGEPVWQAGNGMLSYSSPQLEQLFDVPQVLMMTEDGLTSYDPSSGAVLWEHSWPLGGGAARIIQPKRIGDDFLIGTGYGLGTRRISVQRNQGSWSTTERWTSLAMKPYFNDFVIHDNHIYGFDKNIFSCVDLEEGRRVWKRGRYGHGQVLLVKEDGLLLVLSEKGEAVLLQADSSKLQELHRFQAVDGKTWNQPVIADGKLYVRNGVEAACFDISTTAKSDPPK